MRFSSAIVLAVVAALASSPIYAMPAEAGADICPNFCKTDEVCKGCAFGICYLSFFCIYSSRSHPIWANCRFELSRDYFMMKSMRAARHVFVLGPHLSAAAGGE
ncbi:hypothetical protein BDR05DRAFT_1023683 [Suillus weaverae]|nr:hypothetical protein BDR05DRAFT_1023683 [Suillus weaverae]